MSTPTELPRPGVEVVQEFRTVSPTVVTPTLPACVVGVAKEVVEVVEQDAAGNSQLNSDAAVVLPAFFLATSAGGDPPSYGGLDGEILELAVNNGAPVQVVFSDPTSTGLSPATVVSQVRDRLDTVGITAVVAETVGLDAWRLRSVALGEFQTIVVGGNTTDAVLAAFGIGRSKTYQGLGVYNQYQVDIPQPAFPDPRGNLGELVIDSGSIRVFLATSGRGNTTLTEFLRDEAFLRNGLIDTTATVTGDVAITDVTLGAGGIMTGDQLTVVVDGVSTTAVIGTVTTQQELLDDLEAKFPGASFSLNASDFLVVSTDTAGGNGSISLAGGSALTDIFTTGTGGAPYAASGTSVASVDDGNGDIVTPLIEFDGEDFVTAGTAAAVDGSQAVSFPLTAGQTLILSDGQQPQTITFTAAADIATVVAEINAVVGPDVGGKITASDAGGDVLRLTHSDLGEQSYIEIVGGTALGSLDGGGTPTIAAGTVVFGDPHPPIPGDELYIDGVFYATITEVAPGGDASRLKIDRQVAISSDVGQDFYIKAKNLVSPYTNRPYPDLLVSSDGDVQVKHNFLRDVQGNPSPVIASIYLAYTAVRQDVTPLAANPGLLRFDSITTLTSTLSPVSADNPLALGLFFALINAPGAQVSGLGVDAVSEDEPFGTVEAYVRALEFLESFEVYALAPLTHSRDVGELFKTHVTFMSEPENKGERIALYNPEVPTRALDTLVGSGTDGDKLTSLTFDTKIPALAALVQAAGVNPVGTIEASAGLFLDFASDNNSYSISSINGSVVTIRTSFSADDNIDAFYATTDFSSLTLISETFAVRVRGAELTVPGTGQADRAAIAANVGALASSFGNRRLWMTFPDSCAASLGGVEQVLGGFYMNAAIAGMISQQPPQQSFTNFPMTGFTRVIGSNGIFSERQLNQMAGGGTYIIVQDGVGAPLTSRMALTTDVTSIETRTDSITKVVDFTAKFLRRSVKVFIGRFNITQSFLDSLGSVLQGCVNFLTENGILIGGTLNNIIQDEDQPDTVLVDITLDVPYPCNYVRLTLVI